MKRILITLALIAATTLCFGQAKKGTVKVDTVQITFSKQIAVTILKALDLNNNILPIAGDKISLNDGILVQQVNNFFIEAIYRKWPDLIPKPGKSN